MDTSTGKLVMDICEVPAEERHRYVEVRRNLSKQEILARQIKLYSPCGCGSGKKFKFCCHVSAQKCK